ESDALQQEATTANYVDVDSLLAAIGEGNSSAKAVAQKLKKSLMDDSDEHLASTVSKPRQFRSNGNKVGINVEGFDDMLVRLSRCCAPVPGDQIIGFVTRG